MHRKLPSALTTAIVLLSTLSAQAATVGNLNCGDAEYFKPFKFIDNSTPGPQGTNVGIIVDGYFVVIFTPDSGAPPGEFGVYDISNPRAAVERKHIENADTAEFREAHSLPVAIIGDKEYVAIQTTKGIQIWDFSDPLNASRYSKLDLPGVAGGDYDNVAWQTTWQGRYLYVSGSNQGIYVIDTIDPKAPKLLKQVPNSKTGGFRVGPLFALGDYLVISNMDQDASVAVLDISQPAEPALLGQKGGLPRLYTTLAANDRIYGAGRDGDLTITSFADPTEISEVKSYKLTQDILYVAYQDDHIFAGRQDNFVKVDIRDEKNPKPVGEGTLSREHPDHGQVTPIGNLVYVGNDHGSGSAFFCHQRGKDTTPPKVDRVYPKDGSVDVPKTSRITLSLSDYIDTRTINKTNVIIRPFGGAALDGIYTYAFNTLSFSPNVPFAADQTYEIVLAAGGMKDAMGNGLAAETLVRFSTGKSIDTTPPVGTGGGGQGGTAGGAGANTAGQPSTSTGGASQGGVGGTSSQAGSGGRSQGGKAATNNPASDAGSESSCECTMTSSPRPAGAFLSFALAAFAVIRRRSRR
jgi:MYXO-CTERM domain-containing protein